MFAEAVLALLLVASDIGVLNRPVHALDLAVGPRDIRLGQAVVDVVLRASQSETVAAERVFSAVSCLTSAAVQLSSLGFVKWIPLSVSIVWRR